MNTGLLSSIVWTCWRFFLSQMLPQTSVHSKSPSGNAAGCCPSHLTLGKLGVTWWGYHLQSPIYKALYRGPIPPWYCWWLVFPTIYRQFYIYIPDGCLGFLPSMVLHQGYLSQTNKAEVKQETVVVLKGGFTRIAMMILVSWLVTQLSADLPVVLLTAVFCNSGHHFQTPFETLNNRLGYMVML